MISSIIAIYIGIGVIKGLIWVVEIEYLLKKPYPEYIWLSEAVGEVLNNASFTAIIKYMCKQIFLWPIYIVGYIKFITTGQNKRA